MLSLLTNTSASVAQRNLGQTNARISSSLEKLSSGLRVNKASDDVASMAIGSRLDSELTALRTVATNAGQAVSLLQIAEGVYSRTNDMLVRMKSLSAQAANGTLSNTERQLLDVEFQAIISEIDRVASDTTFNGTSLVDANDTDITETDPTDGTGGTVRAVGALTQVAAAATIDITGHTEGTPTDVTFTVDLGADSYTGVLAAQHITVVAGANNDTVNGQQIVTLTSTTGKGSIVLELNDGYGIGVAANAGDDGTLDVDNGATETGSQSFNFRVGSGSNSSEDVIAATIYNTGTQVLGFEDQAGTVDVDITTVANANKASAIVDAAINYVIDARAEVGATQNRVETARTNLATTIENTEAAKSSYLDSDVASEITKFTSQQILLQSGISTLAQANQIPQNLLSLFQ